MANKLFAEVVIAGSYKNLSKSTRGAKQELTGFEKAAKKISGAVKAAFAGIALLGINALGDAIKDMTKSAANDAKSMALLNKQIDNSWKVTDKTYASVDNYIQSISNMTGILDDDLRPAFSKIVSVTHGSGKAFKAFNMVMDVSAGTGKDVNAVAQAMAKYLGGNTKALDKLVPGIKDASDKMGFLKSKYDGMSKVAGANDPFARINAVMDNFKERLGTAFLPVVQKFADWLASGESQKALDDIATKVMKFGEWFASPAGQEAFKGWMDDLKTLLGLVADFLGLVGSVTKLFDTQKNQKKVLASESGRMALNPLRAGLGYKSTAEQIQATGNMAAIGGTPVVQHITINGAVSGNDVVKALKNMAGQKGMTLGRILR